MVGSSKTLAATLLALATTTLSAAPFTAIRSGDIDGFGFTSDVPTLRAANGSAVDTDGDGRIELGEFLPDLNRDTVTSVTFDLHLFDPMTFPRPGTFVGFDDFDNRSAGDAAGTTVGGGGFIDTGTSGSAFTDLSLSQSFGLAGVYKSPGNPGPFAFPDGSPQTLPNQPGYAFRFTVAKGDINPAQELFFNLLIGDYDVVPAEVSLFINDGAGGTGAQITLPLTVQENTADGLVQGAFATLAFSDIFSDGGAVWNGFLNVDVLAPNEPYLAYDFVELSTRPIFTVPAPTALTLLMLGLTTIGLRRRQARA